VTDPTPARDLFDDVMQAIGSSDYALPSVFRDGEVAARALLARADEATALRAEVERLREALTAIASYIPFEVVKDEFSYDRMVDAYRTAANDALAAPEPDAAPTPEEADPAESA